MLNNFDEMKRTKEFDLDKDFDFNSCNRIYLQWYETNLFNIVAECNDKNMYGVVKMLDRKLFIEPNKYKNNTSGIDEMVEELFDTLLHMIKTEQAKAYANKDFDENLKLEELMGKLGLTPFNKDNTDFSAPIKNLEELSNWELEKCGILEEDMRYHHKDNPVEDYQGEFTPMSQYTFQLFAEARTYYERYDKEQNFYREVGGFPILATSKNYPISVRNLALNNEFIKLIKDRDVNGPKR